MKISILCILLMSVLSLSAKQKFYKWTDASGNTHYSQEKPENQKTSELELNESASETPVSYDNNENRVSNQKRIEELYKQREESQKLKQQRSKKCNKAKSVIAKFQVQTRFGRKDPQTGETLYLKDKQRQKIINTAQQAVRQNCR